MTGFLDRLASRAQGAEPALAPRPFSAFEPGGALNDPVEPDLEAAGSTGPGQAASSLPPVEDWGPQPPSVRAPPATLSEPDPPSPPAGATERPAPREPATTRPASPPALDSAHASAGLPPTPVAATIAAVPAADPAAIQRRAAGPVPVDAAPAAGPQPAAPGPAVQPPPPAPSQQQSAEPRARAEMPPERSLEPVPPRVESRIVDTAALDAPTSRADEVTAPPEPRPVAVAARPVPVVPGVHAAGESAPAGPGQSDGAAQAGPASLAPSIVSLPAPRSALAAPSRGTVEIHIGSVEIHAAPAPAVPAPAPAQPDTISLDAFLARRAP